MRCRGSYLWKGIVLGFLALVAWWPVAAGHMPIVIITQPQDQAVRPGQTATFSVGAASGAARLHYQWYRLARAVHPRYPLPIHGATAPSYTTPPESLRQDGSEFFVRVSLGWSSVQSRRALLTVRAVTPPAQPGVSLAPFVTGGKTGLVASTTDQGPGMTYTWVVTGGVLTAGQGTPSITFTAGVAGTTLKASVRVVNAGGRASGSASARIVAAPNAEQALPILVHPGDGWMQASVPAQKDVTYLWTVVPGSASAILTAGQGSGVVAFTAGNSEGTFQLQVNVQNLAGDHATCIRTVTVRRGTFLVENGGPTLLRTDDTATLLPSGRVLVVGGYDDKAGNQSVATVEIYDPVTGHWNRTGDLGTPRLGHTATLLSDGRVLVAGGAAGAIGFESLASAELYDPLTGVWTPTGQMSIAHNWHTSTLLPNGRVLVTGGLGYSNDMLTQSELYDPGTGTWTITGSMSKARYRHTATLLPGGQVLVTGGGGASGIAERYDPVSGTWSPAGTMLATDRRGHTATRLRDGRVLVAGGAEGGPGAEVYDASTNTWSLTGVFGFRASHTAVLLSDGRVLVAGGVGEASIFSSTMIYDPGTGLWSSVGDLAIARGGHTATLLPSGLVLVAGGAGLAGDVGLPEFFDPAAGIWTAQTGLGSERNGHTATQLPDGRVLVVGGISLTGITSDPQGLLYDPKTRSWVSAPGMKASRRAGHTATLLKDGRVLVVGGDGTLGSAELYDPGSGTWTPTGSLRQARSGHTANLLPSGLVLVTGGDNARVSKVLADSELYDPATGNWSPTGGLAVARSGQAATPLPDGGILVVGGNGGFGVGPLASAERYDPGTGTWRSAGATALQRTDHTATLLSNGRVLVAGGSNGTELYSPITGAELYDPATNSWTSTGSLGTARQDHAAVLLPGGHVLVIGGNTKASTTSLKSLASAEEYDPSTGTWTTTGSLETERSGHTATLLKDGNVLVAFGANGDVITEIYKP